MFWNGSTAIEGLSGSGSARSALGGARCVCRPSHRAIDLHRPLDVLELLLAEILEGDIELARASDRARRRDADAAGLGQRFKPRGDVDAVAIDVAVLDDDVAEIDADAKHDAPVVLGTPALRSAMPRCHSIAQRTASTTLVNSTRMPSPVVFTIWPLCSAIA